MSEVGAARKDRNPWLAGWNLRLSPLTTTPAAAQFNRHSVNLDQWARKGKPEAVSVECSRHVGWLHRRKSISVGVPRQQRKVQACQVPAAHLNRSGTPRARADCICWTVVSRSQD